MSEFESSQPEIEIFREEIGQGIEEILTIIASGQDTDLAVDPFSLRLGEVAEPDLPNAQRIVLRDTLYSLIGRSTVEKTIPVSTYSIHASGEENDITVNVFEGNYAHPETEELIPVFLHETVDTRGGYSWVISSNKEHSPLFVGSGIQEEGIQEEGMQKEEIKEEIFEDSIIKEAKPTLEFSLAIAEQLKAIFPEYANVLQDTFKKNGRICLYETDPDQEGLRRAINLIASPTKFGYILGHVAEGKSNKLAFKYKNLPRIIETQTKNGVQMDHPQTEWEFDKDDQEKRVRSFNEMEGILELLREHGEF